MTFHQIFKVIIGKAALGAVLPLLCLAAQPVFAQSAEVRSMGVYYVDGSTNINDVYCNWDLASKTDTQIANAYKGGIVNVGDKETLDPWQTSALIEYDQPYPDPKSANNYPNHCLGMCMDVYCTNKPNGAATYSISFPIQNIRFEIAKYYGSKDINNPDTAPAVRTIDMSVMKNKIYIDGAAVTENVDLSNYMCAAYSCWGSASQFVNTQSCPNPQYECVSRASLIKSGYDEADLCKELTVNPGNLDMWDAEWWGQIVERIDTDADQGYCCRRLADSEGQYNITPSVYTASAMSNSKLKGQLDGKNIGTDGAKENEDWVYCGFSTSCKEDGTSDDCANGRESLCIIRAEGTGKGYNDPIRFCAPWDGSYEILGEFGKTNGQYGVRGTVHTDYPGDGIAVEQITIDQTFTYPGNNQYPIQVDVTNVHTVRSTPSVVGGMEAVAALPYNIRYRLSKDADVKMQIFDASAVVPTTNQGDTNISDNDAELVLTQDNVVRTLVDWKPRLGEGIKGSESDKLITESEDWDGRDDSGRLLPANNYLVSIQAKSQDEWPGTDFSRAVTRQISVDPLKLTDIQVEGLNKRSTAYATIHYVPTENSNVYFNVYSPGTTFESLDTLGSAPTGTAPTITNNSGSLIYQSQQQRSRGLSYPDKWDGLCHNADGCAIPYAKGTKLPFSGDVFDGTAASCTAGEGTLSGNNCVVTYANGAPLPDGDYVYVLWAEIPYTDTYTNAAGKVYTGVKTLKYKMGLISVERGLVDITIQPVSYSTIGSSPTAYGLDPFIFKYSIAREANVNAYVKNTAGVIVKTLTDEGGNTNVAQQMNTLSWDGRDNAGRMVGPGTYMFVVETRDPMFPLSVQTQASAIFPVDLYRVVDVTTTDVYGDSEARATINYYLSKAMNVQIDVYNKDVVIPAQNQTGTTTTQNITTIPAQVTAVAELANLTALNTATTGTNTAGNAVGYKYVYTQPTLTGDTYSYYRVTKNVTAVNETNNTETYQVTEILLYNVKVVAWPPRICDKQSDAAVFTNGYVDPAKNPSCIYVNDTTFTNYPANAQAAKYNYTEGAQQTLDVRLQPIKTFNRSATKAGDGVKITEEWDAQYFYNPTPVSVLDGGKNSVEAVNECANQTDLTQCPYEMVPDGTYPFYISAKTEEPVNLYYDKQTAVPNTDGAVAQTGLYATEKPVYRLNVTRGPVYFLDGSVAVYPNAPQLFNTSSGPVFVPPYEINFAISRAATVQVAVVALEDGLCTTQGTTMANGTNVYSAKAGDVCKYLSTMTIVNTPNFDPNIIRKIYWDGTDNNGKYVRNGNYEVRLTAINYPDAGLYQPTIKQLTLNVDLLKVFDLPETESYAINVRGTDMKVSYQISVPMKVAIQIFKPGTTIYDYQKGTLRDPATGKEVQDIRDVLVKTIVGIRPSTTLIEELWDGTDYAQQDVPDGTYPFRFVTALNTADIDTITGEIIPGDDKSATPADWKIQRVADTYQYVNLHNATVAIGDGQFVCEDWEKTVFFYPNPFKTPTGTLEVTKLPVPGKMSIKLYNLAGDLVREKGFTCVDANNMSVVMNGSLDLRPDNSVSNNVYTGNMPSVRNAALRCFWDRTNDHGKKVARGVYFGLVDFRAQNGRQHCQKVVKILIPR
ncbi:MAG: hypothetical protein IKC13_06620 [Elusimicrobiaceae bacterium]|nr:hypothetical protein [Elusimicrobiaceae bacterium]